MEAQWEKDLKQLKPHRFNSKSFAFFPVTLQTLAKGLI